LGLDSFAVWSFGFCCFGFCSFPFAILPVCDVWWSICITN
jgi:hypothetical protein